MPFDPVSQNSYIVSCVYIASFFNELLIEYVDCAHAVLLMLGVDMQDPGSKTRVHHLLVLSFVKRRLSQGT